MPAEIQVRGLDHFAQRMEPDQNGDIGFGVNVVAWDGTRSFQGIWCDFQPAATFGSSTNATATYGGAAVRGEIGDLTTSARAAILAVMGGDSGTATANAAFGVDWNASTGASGFQYGLDLEGLAPHDNYTDPYYSRGFLRFGGRKRTATGEYTRVNDIVVMAGTAVPTDGTSGTGVAFAGPGSLYIRQSGSNSNLLINTGTAASPTWSAIP